MSPFGSLKVPYTGNMSIVYVNAPGGSGRPSPSLPCRAISTAESRHVLAVLEKATGTVPLIPPIELFAHNQSAPLSLSLPEGYRHSTS